MQTRKLTRHPIQRSSLRASPPQSNALPRRIAAGVFFLDADGVNNIDSDSDDSNDPLPSAKTLATLGITHAVVERGSDLRLTCGMKALFVGRQDPLSRVVGWMRAVRRLGAHIIVSDFAAAAGYLLVELGLTPRTAWLRMARGIPPVGDPVLARLCALAYAHHRNEKEAGPACISESASLKDNGGPAIGGKYQGFGTSPRSCRSQRTRMRSESGLKHVIII